MLEEKLATLWKEEEIKVLMIDGMVEEVKGIVGRMSKDEEISEEKLW